MGSRAQVYLGQVIFGPTLPLRSVIIRYFRHRNLAPQCWPYCELSDCLFKCIALVTGYDSAQVLEALANYVARPAGHSFTLGSQFL
jgi:hypothetical protein